MVLGLNSNLGLSCCLNDLKLLNSLIEKKGFKASQI